MFVTLNEAELLPLLFLHISLANLSEEVKSDIWKSGSDLLSKEKEQRGIFFLTALNQFVY